MLADIFVSNVNKLQWILTQLFISTNHLRCFIFNAVSNATTNPLLQILAARFNSFCDPTKNPRDLVYKQIYLEYKRLHRQKVKIQYTSQGQFRREKERIIILSAGFVAFWGGLFTLFWPLIDCSFTRKVQVSEGNAGNCVTIHCSSTLCYTAFTSISTLEQLSCKQLYLNLWTVASIDFNNYKALVDCSLLRLSALRFI